MSDTPNANNALPDSGGQPKKSKKLFLIIGLVVVLLAGGGGGYYFMSKSSASAAEKESKSEKKKKSAEAEDSEESEAKDEKDNSDKSTSAKDTLKASLPDDSDVKEVVELQPFIINLADTEDARYLRMTVSIGIGEEGGEKPSPLFLTRVKNAMLAVLSVKKSDEVLSIEGKTKLRKELLQAAQAASEKPKVEAIYITDFIVQL